MRVRPSGVATVRSREVSIGSTGGAVVAAVVDAGAVARLVELEEVAEDCVSGDPHEARNPIATKATPKMRLRARVLLM